MIKDYLSEVKSEHEWIALQTIAEEAMAESAWRAGDEIGIEKIFEFCKESTLRNLKRRLDHWQSKVAAIQTHDKIAH